MILDNSHLLNSLDWRSSLLDWYDTNKRAFPWRDYVTPYRTWICEVMSQQTTLAVVVPRFTEFIKKLPDVEALASASDEVLRSLWAGLGYYARARNLRSGAQYILSQLQGRFPQSYEEWLNVPGVGPYTASVIVSICFNLPKACVDGNVIRVISRLTATSALDVWTEGGKDQIQSFVDQVIDERRPGDFNQAMMELGATLCSKQSPDCHCCPVRKFCHAFAQQRVEHCPPNKPRKEFLQIKLLALVVASRHSRESVDESILLAERQQGFLSGTVGFPLLQYDDSGAVARLCAGVEQLSQIASVSLRELNVRHTITRHKLAIGQLYITLKPECSSHGSAIRTIFEVLDLSLSRETWVSKKLVPHNVSSSLDLKVWEKIS